MNKHYIREPKTIKYQACCAVGNFITIFKVTDPDFTSLGSSWATNLICADIHASSHGNCAVYVS